MKEGNYKYIKYWVGSDGESPEKIYFNSGDALNSEHRYLDSFDDYGDHVLAYALIDDRYTTDF